MPVKNRFAELLPEIIAWRRDFHAHPELMFDLPRTAGRVAELLRGFGADEVVEGIGRSGVVAVIRGRTDSRGRAIGLRADMDALPIEEETGLPHASTTPGKMHACGHDGHMAMLLGAAKYLAETRAFDGTAVLVFQPAEEGGGGGDEMVRDGLMERFGIDEIYGMHNWPGVPLGTFAIREGAVMAACDQFRITVTGRGGHAAKPHQAIDPVLVASQIVVALQTVASRLTDPLAPVVLSVCTLRAGTGAYNVIPQTAELRGTLRSLDPDLRPAAEAQLRRIASLTAEAAGASAALDWMPGYPATVNALEPTRAAIAVAQAVAGSVDTDFPPQMAAEDFSYMLNARPGAYIFCGNGDSAILHHPGYEFNDEAIPFGASWYAGMIEARMPLD